MRRLLGIVVGVVVGGLAVAAVETLGHRAFPLRTNVDTSNVEAMRALLASAPLAALISVAVAWFLGASVGGSLSGIVGRSPDLISVGIPVAVLFAGTVAALVTIPHPLWLVIVGVAVYPLALLVALAVARRFRR